MGLVEIKIVLYAAIVESQIQKEFYIVLAINKSRRVKSNLSHRIDWLIQLI